MIIDAHTHIFPDAVCENRQAYFDGEPEFQLLYEPPQSRLVNADTLVAEMDAQGVDMAVTFGFPWHHPAYFQENNDCVMDAVHRYPDRLRGFCCLDVLAENAADEVERCFAGGLSGVGELAFYQGGFSPETLDHLEPVMAICRERDAPVMIHTNEPIGHMYPGKTPNTLSEIYELIKRFPDNRIILAHWGGGIFFYMLMKKEVRENLANVYFDTAASPFLYTPQIYPVAAEIAGAEKILWGTDFPLIRPGRYFREIEGCGLSKEQTGQLLGANAKRLLGL
ncbi:MAG TPA: amidohydrolase family protein [Desulfosalsimonadaceae bacterium]|nr:amidohydrolase family protein [Desulfosalsimonadaceae bacterium]